MKYGLWIIFAIALAGAFFLDAKVVAKMHEIGADAWLRGSWVRHVLKAPGYFPITLVIAGLIAIRHRRAAITIVFAGVLSGSNWLIKWIAGRPRPDWRSGVASMDFHPFPGGIVGLFQQKGLAFPSGHTALAFATAAGVAVWFPRWRWPAYAVAAIVAVERVAENAHHLSDVVAAAALGIASAYVAKWLIDERNVPLTGDPLLQRAGERPDAAEAR